MIRKNLLLNTSALLALTAPVASAANLLTNGDFESFSGGGSPSTWVEAHGDVTTTQVTGLDGTGSAVQIGNASGGSAAAAIGQTFSPISSSFTLQFDFQLLATGNATNNGSRILNFTLRNSSGDPYVNARTLFDGNNNGALQFYAGGSTASWISITGQTELFNQSDVYRITLTGQDTQSSSRNYDVSLFNVTDGTSAGGATGITDFHFQNATTISDFRFERGRSSNDYIVDNVSLVPEPSTALLSLLTAPLLLIRRRK